VNRIRYLWRRLLNLSTPWEKLEPKGELVNETESTLRAGSGASPG